MLDGPRFHEISSRQGTFALAGILSLAIFTRAAGLGQPIVENYVGRQIPTAMVARNLERGSGFFRPSLDVAPFPNLFLVEPPIFASFAVGLRRLTGLPLDSAGRLVSAFGIVLGGWGLYGLAASREGSVVALGAVAAFVMFPVTLRYGRAFQPDALMLGCLIAGLRLWDALEDFGGIARLAGAWCLVAMGLALKVTSVWIMVPLVMVVLRDKTPCKLFLVATTLIPAAIWYIVAATLIATGEGSRASTDNGSIWLSVLEPVALFRGETYRHVFRFLVVRAFTPLGPILALFGLIHWKTQGDRLWLVWGGSALAMLVVLAAKLHHEYYWLSVAPILAVGASRTISGLARGNASGKALAAITGALFIGLSAVFSASTWRTPPEWISLREAGREVQHLVPEKEWIVASEALLYEADRRGCRLELTTPSARRAVGEWGEELSGDGPLALVEFYRKHGASFFADVTDGVVTNDRLALHKAVRHRYKVMRGRPGVLIAKLVESREDARDGRGPDQRNNVPDRRDDP